MRRFFFVISILSFISLTLLFTPVNRSFVTRADVSEGEKLAMYSKPEEIQAYRRRGAFIQYADLADLMVMLDLKVGGGVMAAVNEGQRLVCPRTAES